MKIERGHELFARLRLWARMYRKSDAGNYVMTSATIPPLRVTPELREAAESVLRENESLSAFVESSVVKQIEFRKAQNEFISRGLAAKKQSEESGSYVNKAESLAALDAILEKYDSSK
ncbi:MAG: YlcI/YnfO family protein [Sedimenticolaceae bacterium]